MKIRDLAAGVAAATLLVGAGACGGGASDSGGGTQGVTIKYWATNQGSSLDNDKRVLAPEIAKFTQQTGIKVDLQVVPWSDMTNNTLAAAVSGKGPDVVNIGNTNATTFQNTGAFYGFDSAALDKVGGKDHFVPSALATAGPEGKDPTSLPLYGQVYGLYYNKALFSAAALAPPATWEDLVAAAQKLTDPGKGRWGIVAPGGVVNVSMHYSFILTAQNGASPFTDDGKPDFTSTGMVAGITRYLQLMSKYHVMNPSVAQYTDGTQAAVDFAKGKAGMLMAQTANVNTLQQNGMGPDKYGVVPIPAPAGGTKVGSFVAGTNISIFKNTKHLDTALQFVKFMTSSTEQEILNKAYTTLPVAQGVQASAFEAVPDQLSVWTQILAQYSTPLPRVRSVQAYQTNVGGAVVALMAKAATGAIIDEGTVKAAMAEAQQKMPAS